MSGRGWFALVWKSGRGWADESDTRADYFVVLFHDNNFSHGDNLSCSSFLDCHTTSALIIGSFVRIRQADRTASTNSGLRGWDSG